MRRYQYRLNDQNVSVNTWGVLTPLKYIDVVPGETYGGTISVKPTSAVAKKVIHSRAYYDLYAFYIPYRLLWPEFTDFIAKDQGEVKPPQSMVLRPWNFESSFVGSDGITTEVDGQTYGTNSSLLIRAYEMIWNQFFYPGRDTEERKQQITAGNYDQSTAMRGAYARPSTWESSWKDDGDVAEQQIAVNQDSTVDLQNIRRAYMLDRYEKIREYYGARYTDYLKGVGVKADWGILQEPECIGLSNNDFKFVQRSSTEDDTLGKRRGYFEGDYKLKLRKTFCPEHGVIAVMAVARADIFNETAGSNRICAYDLEIPQVFYDPHLAGVLEDQSGPKSLLDSGAGRSDRFKQPPHEHLRKGTNQVAAPDGYSWDNVPVFSKSMTSFLDSTGKWLQQICKPLETDFVDNVSVEGRSAAEEKVVITGGTLSHFTECRLAKRSPVKPSGQTVLR